MPSRTLSLLLTAVIVLFSYCSFAQNAAINEDGSAPNHNAILDIKSLTKGVLLPRVSTAGRLAIPNTKGMLVYDTTTNSYWFNTGTAWQNLSQTAATATGWLLTGNSGTDVSSFIGTTDGKPLLIKTDNTPSGRIDPRFEGNTFLGYNTAPSFKPDSAEFNTGIGANALTALTTGFGNTAMGSLALTRNTRGSFNTATGEGSLNSNTTGNNNTASGYLSLSQNSTGSNNAAFGSNSMNFNTTGSTNSAFGTLSLQGNSTGSNNTALGYSALSSNSTGHDNTVTGIRALSSNTTGSRNTVNGQDALSANVFGWDNTAIGALVLSNSSAHENTGVGFAALNLNTTGTLNTAVGVDALESNATASENTAVGWAALRNNVSGSLNTAIGALADVDFQPAVSNSVVIGASAFVNVSNKVRIGNSAVTVIEGQVPFTTPSDGRFKFQVKEDVKGLDFIMHLRPVTYQFDVKRFDEEGRRRPSDQQAQSVNKIMQAAYTEAAAIRRSGFIAQEVEKAADASDYNFSGIIKPQTEQDHYSLSYEAFVVPLVKGMQEQQRIIEAQNKRIEAQAEALTALQKQLDEIKKRLSL